MYSYLVRRLLPFFVVAVSAELLELIIVSILKYTELDLTFLPLIKMSGVLFLTTMVSFLYIMLPYVFYLLLLPCSMQNSKLDYIVGGIVFRLFVFFCLTEESLSVWLIYTQNTKIILDTNGIWSSLLNNWLILCNNWHVFTAIICVSLAVILVGIPYVFPKVPAPKFGKRLYHSAIYVLICTFTYINIDIKQLKIDAKQLNEVVSEEGSYYIIKTINEQEIVPVIKKINPIKHNYHD